MFWIDSNCRAVCERSIVAKNYLQINLFFVCLFRLQLLGGLAGILTMTCESNTTNSVDDCKLIFCFARTVWNDFDPIDESNWNLMYGQLCRIII